MPDQVVAHRKTLASFKETEVGAIPADWDVVPLSKVVTLSRKPRDLELSVYEAIPFVPMALIPEEGVSIEGYAPKQPSDIKSGTYFERGDVLLAKITPSFENGKQAIAEDIPLPFGYATTEVYPLHPQLDKLDRMFLFNYLKLPSVRAEIAGKMEGTTGRQRIPKQVIETYPIPLPRLPEQRRIAHVLRTIQRAIAAQEHVIAAARELKRSLMQRLFTYGPGPEPSPTKDTEMGPIPEHWEVARLGEISDFSAKPRGLELSSYPTIPFIPMEMIPEDGIHIIDYVPKTPAQIRSGTYCEKGDVLLAKITPSFENGKQGIVDAIPTPFAYATTEVYPIKVQPERLERMFLFYFLKMHRVRTEIAGKMEGTTGRQRVPKSVIEDHVLPLPPLDEQREIAACLSPIEDKIEAGKRRKAALQALFQSMLQQLMTGQIRVKDIDR